MVMPKSSSKFAKGELMVKLDSRAKQLISVPIKEEGTKLAVPRFGIKELDDILENLGATEIIEVTPDIFLIRMPMNTELDVAKEKISNSGWVKDIDFNYLGYTS
jgi:hypothetical protein